MMNMSKQNEISPIAHKRFSVLMACAALAAGLSACAGTNNRVTETAPTSTETAANAAAVEAEAPYFVQVEFDKGSNRLTEQSRAAITSLIDRARAEGQVQDVKVLSWADQEYPSVSQKRLSKPQRDLAKSRNRAITDHVKGLNYGVDVDTHSMEERPAAVSRWFNTSDARFKRSLVAAGLPTTAEEAPVTGRASHAVVLVTLKP